MLEEAKERGVDFIVSPFTELEIERMIELLNKEEQDERLTALEAEGWKWWVVPASKYRWWGYVDNNSWKTSKPTLALGCFRTKQEAEAACVEYLLKINRPTGHNTEK